MQVHLGGPLAACRSRPLKAFFAPSSPIFYSSIGGIVEWLTHQRKGATATAFGLGTHRQDQTPVGKSVVMLEMSQAPGEDERSIAMSDTIVALKSS